MLVTIELKNLLKKYSDDLSTNFGTYYNFRNKIMVTTFSIKKTDYDLVFINDNPVDISTRTINWLNTASKPLITPVSIAGNFLKNSNTYKIDFLSSFWSNIDKYYVSTSNQVSRYLNYLENTADDKMWFILFQPVDQYGRIYQNVGFGAEGIKLKFNVPDGQSNVILEDAELHVLPFQGECDTVVKKLGTDGTINISLN